MGFFSSLLTTVGSVAGAFLGTQAAAPVAAPLAQIAAPPAATVIPAGILGGVAQIGAQAAQAALRTGVAPGAACPPTGRLRRRTTVETFDPVTGVVCRSETFAGGVAVRDSDVTAAKRVFRQVRRIDKRLPRKTVKESAVKQLTDRVVKNALERAGDIPDCPK